MNSRFLQAVLVLTVLLISRPVAIFSQINVAEQMAGRTESLQGGQKHSAPPSALHASGLAVVPEDFEQLKLAPGFLVGLSVLDDSDFDGSFRVDQGGDIAVPILGTIHVAGETAPEARIQIQRKLLDDQILKNPQVALNVLEYTAPQVTIIGEVASPGKYPLLAPRKLLDVLALAGGPTNLAGNEVQITPSGAEKKPILVHYSKATDPRSVENVIVNPGDTVQMKRAGIVYVMGAVNRPGGYVMQEEGTLNMLQALSLAYGTSPAASTGRVYVLRRNSDGVEVDIALPYKQISEGKRADIQLHAADVLYVPTSKVKSILTNSQQILTAAGSAAIYRY